MSNEDHDLVAELVEEREPPPHPGFWWALLWCLGLIVVTQVVPMILGVALFLILSIVSGKLPGQRMDDQAALVQSSEFAHAMLLAMGFGQILTVSLGWLVSRLIIGNDWMRILGVRLPSPSQFVLTLLFLPGLLFLSTGVEALARELLPSLFDMDEMMTVFGKWPWPLGVLIIGLGPGIGEELWFRGFFGRGLVGRHGMVVGVFLTALLFGLMHMDPRQAAVTFVMGLFLHATYLATRSLLVPMLLHLGNNVISLLASRLSGLGIFTLPGAELPWYVYAAAVVLTVTVLWGFWRCRTRLTDQTLNASWRQGYVGVEWPPWWSATDVVRPVGGVLTWLVVLAGALTFASVVPGFGDIQREEQARRRDQERENARALEQERNTTLQLADPKMRKAKVLDDAIWTRMAVPDARFEVMLPGPAPERYAPIGKGAGKRVWEARGLDKQPYWIFRVQYLDITPEVSRRFTMRQCEEAMCPRHGRLLHEKKLTLGSAQGKEYVALGPGAEVTRILTVPAGDHTHLYALTVQAFNVRPDDKDISRFLDSFGFDGD